MADDEQAVSNFRSYLRIPSVQPNVDYTECVSFLTQLGQNAGLTVQVLEQIPKKPIVLMTLLGTQKDLPSILLNSHMDVVAVFPELWHHDPFGAEIDEDGNIFGRGAQDTKSIGIQYIEAIRRLKKEGKTFKRTVHISFVPDEEEGEDGVEHFVNTPEFVDLNVGFTLDEGSANYGPEYFIFYGEKAVWHTTFVVTGTEGHGSLALVDTAGEKLRRLVDLVMDYRKSQADKLAANPELTVGNLTFVNMTILQGGVALNVVPPSFSATFDFRLAVDENQEQFEKQLNTWASQSGSGISVEFPVKEPATPITPIDNSNPFWIAMKNTFDSLKQQVLPQILAGGTDSRYLRRKGFYCISFSPMNFTQPLAHANDEYLNRDVFLQGIQVYYNLIPNLANV